MGEILGMGVTHFPALGDTDEHMDLEEEKRCCQAFLERMHLVEQIDPTGALTHVHPREHTRLMG